MSSVRDQIMSRLLTALQGMAGSVTFQKVIRSTHGQPKKESVPVLVLSRGSESKGRENRGYVCRLPVLISMTASHADPAFAGVSTEEHADVLRSLLDVAQG